MTKLTELEKQKVKEQVEFIKQYRELIHKGKFYRLQSPFENNITAWMVVSDDKKEAIVGWYKVLNDVNESFKRIKLKGLNENLNYYIEQKGEYHYGDELMNLGMITSDYAVGDPCNEEILPYREDEKELYCNGSRDFLSKLFILKLK